MRPLISIALCTYNAERFLEPLLQSLLHQTWRPIEIVCCDDKSTDSTILLLEKYKTDLPDIFRININNENLGYIKNFEKCMKLCSGRFIAIADHDDIWKTNKLERLYGVIGDKLMVYSDSMIIDKDGKPTGKKISDIFRLHDHPPAEAFAFYDFIWGHSTLIKKELLGYALPIPSQMPYDTWLAYTAASVSAIGYVDEALTGWREHEASFSNRMFELNAQARQEDNWKYQEYLEKRQRIRLLAENVYGKRSFMAALYERYSLLETGHSLKLFLFLARHHKKLFPIWRRNYISRLNEFRKMARSVKS